jgi:dynein heavy chain, axonemal
MEGIPKVFTYPMNPRALSLAELYGEFNVQTNEWTDGVLSSVMRTICADDKPDQKWVVFDGPVDADWIESMNSVMDDNKLLTLINGERISMPDQVSLLFECQDLAVASPATVSRAGFVFFDVDEMGWRPYVKSWLETVKDADTSSSRSTWTRRPSSSSGSAGSWCPAPPSTRRSRSASS